MAKTKRSLLATLVFTDIVGSTQAAGELGDRRWRELLSRHYRILRAQLREHGGREVDTAGDGAFARFDSPAAAIRFAAAVSDGLRELGVEIRAGIHIGECEEFEGTLSGVNVHAAARTMALADAGQILVTGSVRDLVRGAGVRFADRGVHALKGLEGEWHLYEVTSVDDVPRPPVLTDDEAKALRQAIVPPTLVKRRRVRAAGAAALAALIVAGGSLALARALSHSATGPVAGCEVTTQPPLNDRAFNQAVFDGLTDAATTWGTSVLDRVTQSSAEAGWKRNMNDLLKQPCGLIVSIGSVPAEDTLAAAKANPNRRFLTTDAPAVPAPRNLLNVEFEVDQAAFLAGYLAAGMTTTGTVGTFGGIPIPQVTGFMDGFAAGVRYYDRVQGAKVRVVGWDPKTRTGSFVSTDPTAFNVFGDVDAAARITADLVSLKADIVMPVDGPSGELGAGRAVQHVPGVLLVGVDTDQHFSTPQYEDRWLTSVLKVYRRMVYVAMGEVVHHRFRSGELKGTLANGGVGLAPFYGLRGRVPPTLRAQLDEVRKGIESGSIAVGAGHGRT